MKKDPIMMRLLACGLTLMLCACAAVSAENAASPEISVTVMASGQQCLPAPDTWTVSLIDTPKALDRYLSRCRSHRLGATPVSLPEIDFDRYCALALEMGQKPSAGYGFDTKKVTARLQGQAAMVGVTCHRPLPGAMTAQVLTNPWILIRLPVGPYHQVKIVDQNDRQVAQIEVLSP